MVELAHHRVKLKESERRDKCLDLARELKTLWNMKVTLISIIVGAIGTILRELLKRLKDLEMRTNGDYPDHSIIKICQNTEENPEDNHLNSCGESSANAGGKPSVNAGVKISQRRGKW